MKIVIVVILFVIAFVFATVSGALVEEGKIGNGWIALLISLSLFAAMFLTIGG